VSVVPILLLCSLFLVASAVALFAYSVRQGDCEHADRLSLMPLEEDDNPPARGRPGGEKPETSSHGQD